MSFCNFKINKFKKWKTEKLKFLKISNSMVIKKFLALVVIFYQVHLRNSQKMKQNQLFD